MRSYNHLWEKYISEENYYTAVENAVRHKGGKKRKYRAARYFRENMEKLKDAFITYAANFKNDFHHPKYIYDGIRKKKRLILVPTMREQVIHHMIVNVMQPIFMRGMYEHSYGSLPGRGAHDAKKVIERWIGKKDRNFKYILKMDIKKYFDTIPHDILKQKFARLIHDPRFLDLLYEIIDVVPGNKGIPIGFYTSQWFANWYLQDLDHFIKEDLEAVYYIRYMDDMVIIGPNKRRLHQIKREVERYLNDELGLELKNNWQVYRFNYQDKGRDLDFMGFRFFRNRTILRKNILLKLWRKARKIAKSGIRNIHVCRQMTSYLGWLSITDTYQFYKSRIKPLISFRALIRYMSRWQREQNKEVLYALV